MGHKTENWQDIEVGDIISVGFNWVGAEHDTESVVEKIYWVEENKKCLGVVSSKEVTWSGTDGLWAVVVGEDEDQVKLIRKHNAKS